jgi:hypothetical protein
MGPLGSLSGLSSGSDGGSNGGISSGNILSVGYGGGDCRGMRNDWITGVEILWSQAESCRSGTFCSPGRTEGVLEHRELAGCSSAQLVDPAASHP